jgi:small conductance mechanosensitive channel
MAETAGTIARTLKTSLDSDSLMLVKAGDLLGDLAVNLVLALVIFAVTLWLAGWASRAAKAAIAALPRTHNDVTLQSFAGSVARSAVVIFGLIAVLRRLGVETTSIIAVLGAASLAVGLALQGALSNVAAGVMILILRPYQVGDTVTLAGRTGAVRRLDLFNTELIDPDGLKVVVPNGKAFGDIIVNHSEIVRRRIELTFPLDPGEDAERAAALALKLAVADRRVLADPPAWAKPTELSAGALTLALRVWVSPADHAEARSDLLQAIKRAFDNQGVQLATPLPTAVTVAPKPQA